MKKIKIVPYILHWVTSVDFNTSKLESSIKSIDNKIKWKTASNKDIIWRIISYEIDSDLKWIPKRLYLRIWSNFQNDRTKVQVDNDNVTKSWELQNTQTVLNDLVVSITFPQKWKILVWGNENLWLLYLIYEWHPTYAINSLDYIIDNLFKWFNFSISAFLESNKSLEDIKWLIKSIETNLIDVRQDWSELIIWKTFLRPEYIKDFKSFDFIKLFSEWMFEELKNIFSQLNFKSKDRLIRKYFILSFWKKIPIKEEWWKLLAIGFPQQINLNDFNDEYRSIDHMFYKLFKPDIDNDIVNSTILKISLDPFINEYERRLIS